MKTIILPGYSPQNREWAEEIAAQLPSAVVHHWRHWADGVKFDPVIELTRILDEIKDEEMYLLSKSIGCRVAANLVLKIPEQVRKWVLCGIPSTSEEMEYALAGALDMLAPETVLVIQNKNDPYATYEQVAAMLDEIQPAVRVESRSRSDHNYFYPDDIKSFLMG